MKHLKNYPRQQRSSILHPCHRYLVIALLKKRLRQMEWPGKLMLMLQLLACYFRDVKFVIVLGSCELYVSEKSVVRAKLTTYTAIEPTPLSRSTVPLSLNRSLETLNHRLRLGTAYTKPFLHRIGLADNPRYLCNHEEQDVTHLWLDCPQHDNFMTRLKRGLAALDNRPFILGKVLMSGACAGETGNSSAKIFSRGQRLPWSY